MTIYLSIVLWLLAQPVCSAPSEGLFDSIKTLTDDRQYEEIIELSKNHQIENHFTSDSLAWVQLRISRALLNLGYYDKSLQKITPVHNEIESITSNELKLKTGLLYALSLKKNGKYFKAIDVFEDVLLTIPDENYEQYITATINYANTHWEIAEYDKYGRITNKALLLSQKNNDIRREILTRRNITEYYEYTGEWEKAIAHLDTLSQIVDKHGEQRDIARYKIRAGHYYRDYMEEYDKAIQLFTDARDISKRNDNFQTWEQSSYDLVNIYFLSDKVDRAGHLLSKMKKDPRLQKIPWARQKLIARQVQYHIYTGDISKAEPLIKSLEKSKGITNTESLAVSNHAQAMYYLETDNPGKAREIIITNLNMIIDKGSSINENHGFSANLLDLYQKEKHQSGLTTAQAKDKITQKYINREVNDWVYQTPAETSIQKVIILIILLILGIAGIYFTRNTGKEYDYNTLERSIKAI